MELLWIYPREKEKKVCKPVGSTHLVTFPHGGLCKILDQGLERADQPVLKPHLGWRLETGSVSQEQREFCSGWGALSTLIDAKIKNKSDLRH